MFLVVIKSTFESALAVDGNVDGDIYNGSVTSTKAGYHSHLGEDPDPHWMVDLTGSYDIDSIVVYNRIDCCSERLDNFQLTISSGTSVVDTYNHSGSVADSTEITFDPAVTGDSVKIQLFGDERILSLAEVQVFGTASPGSGSGSCADRTGRWRRKPRGSKRNWCAWLNKKNFRRVCKHHEDLRAGCPVTCNTCP